MPFLLYYHMWEWLIYVNIALLVMMFIMVFWVSAKDPGIIDKRNLQFYQKSYQNYIDRYPPVSLDEPEGHIYTYRKCKSCKLRRPPLSSHCDTCDSCVGHFDHHCTLLNKCIGLHN